MWAHPYVACMGLVLFHARAVFSVGTCRLFPQCMPAIIPLIGSMAGGVTKACTGYSARPPLCYAQPEVSTLISAPLCAWAVCQCQLQEPSRGAAGVSVPNACREIGCHGNPAPRFRCHLTVGHPYPPVSGRSKRLRTPSVAAIPHLRLSPCSQQQSI